MLSIEDFVQDRPTTENIRLTTLNHDAELIDGVILRPLSGGSDSRGRLYEFLTEREDLESEIVHVYQVVCAPGSIRAWQIHKRQFDRLAYTNGSLRVVLYDLRPESATFRKINEIDVGDLRKCILYIPPFVAHAVQNYGDTDASFVNLPTKTYDPSDPDKWRVPLDHPGIPYQFR
jgi:dTDP-4-dehydrorhamnose 3,5-epimerase